MVDQEEEVHAEQGDTGAIETSTSTKIRNTHQIFHGIHLEKGKLLLGAVAVEQDMLGDPLQTIMAEMVVLVG